MNAPPWTTFFAYSTAENPLVIRSVEIGGNLRLVE